MFWKMEEKYIWAAYGEWTVENKEIVSCNSYVENKAGKSPIKSDKRRNSPG